MPLHHKKTGEGAPLILIHGLFGSLENVGAVARFLAKAHTVYSVDLPNHGRSLHTDEIDLDSMADWVLKWMDEHGIKNAHVMGHSLGGKVAMELALRYPARVDKLVVIDIAPVHYPPRHDDVFAGLLSFTPDTLKSRNEADEYMREHVKELPVRSFLLKNLTRNEEGGFSWRMNLPVIHKGYQDLIKGNVADSCFDGPTLFLKGSESDYITERYRDDILSRFPETQLKVIANTGHWLHAEKPEVVSKIVLKFLGE